MKRIKSSIKEFYIHQLTWRNIGTFLKKVMHQIIHATQLIIICVFVFYLAGVGLYLGVIVGSPFAKLTTGNAVVITLIDLKKPEKSND